MYAVINTGGKQYRVEKGARVEVEKVGVDVGAELELKPVLLVDGETVLATRRDLSNAVVKAKVIDETRGPKVNGFVYKSKSNNRRRYGHRQDLSVIEITAINKGRSRTRSTATADAEPDADAPDASTANSGEEG
ncbi:MAG TPA: 50S ribosomal protein L21 [Acidimicrobiia bacterium]|jgi:large subunit ribosomal protein L21